MSHRYHDAALRLHDHISETHLTDGLLIGPDSGVRFNYRTGRAG